MPMRKTSKTITTLLGAVFLPAIWLFLHYIVGVGERFLPDPVRVVQAIGDLQPSLLSHSTQTTIRFALGSALGILFGVATGLLLFKSTVARLFLTPSIQALRAIPPIATVPFFLLWFGFSEIGRYVLVIFGVGLNLAIVTYQILDKIPEKYAVAFRSFAVKPQEKIVSFALPLIAENILPTVRFGLSVAIGLVVVSELLGSQVGLGYVIQTSRSTFALHSIFLATAALGVIMVLVDYIVVKLWQKIIYWK